jgi:hypothetical protein
MRYFCVDILFLCDSYFNVLLQTGRELMGCNQYIYPVLEDTQIVVKNCFFMVSKHNLIIFIDLVDGEKKEISRTYFGAEVSINC